MCPIVGLVLELTHVLTFSPKKVCPVIDSMLDLTDDIVLSSPKMCPATKPPLVADNVPRDRLHVRVLLVANVQPSRQAEALSHVVVCRRGCLVLAGDAGIISQHPLLYIYIALAWGMAYIAKVCYYCGLRFVCSSFARSFNRGCPQIVDLPKVGYLRTLFG